MYMLRTEIRKLGGLICFLFVMLAIQAQQYTVTGGNGVPYLLENPGNRIRVYLVYGMDNVEISYTSSSTNHQWYRYKQKALDREPVPCEQNGGDIRCPEYRGGCRVLCGRSGFRFEWLVCMDH